MGYVWACQHLGYDLNTVVIRGVGILKTQSNFQEATKEFSPFMIQRWLQQTFRDVHRLTNCWNEGYFDYNLGEACTSYSGCPFRILCASAEPEHWYSSFVVRRWNPLERDNKILEEPEASSNDPNRIPETPNAN